MGSLAYILHFARPFRGQIVLYFVLMLLSSVFSVVSIGMALPFLNILFEVDTPAGAQGSERVGLHRLFGFFADLKHQEGPEAALAALAAALVALFFLKNLLRYWAMRVLTPIRTGIIQHLRDQMYQAILAWPSGRFTDSRKGDLLTRFSADVQELEWAVFNSITSLFRDPITILVTLAAMVALSWRLTLFILILLPVSAFVIGRIGRSLKRVAHLGQDELGRLTSLTEETISNVRVIKSFGAEEAVWRQFQELNSRFTQLSRRMINKRELSAPVSEFSGAVVIAVIIWLGGMMVLRGGAGAPDAAGFITFIALFSQIITPAKAVSTTYYNIQKGRASAARIQEVLEAEREATPRDVRPLPPLKQGIRLENVSHWYGDRWVLKHLNLTIEAGKMTALVGRSGAGKSTLADLLAGLMPVKEGAIWWDTVNYAEVPLARVRASVALMPQSHMLFNASVRFNVTLGQEPVDEERLMRAGRQAFATEFIDPLPEGWNTVVGEQGGRFSGGQKQRLALARAFYKDAPVLVLDEATANLDAASEDQVQKALSHLLQGRTAVVIAHKLHTVQRADTIVVLDSGCVVDQGTHPELRERCALYRDLLAESFET